MTQMKILKGRPSHAKGPFAIVVSKFNETITELLLKGALEALNEREIPSDDITVVWVPGAFEIPFITKSLAISNRYKAIIALGCVIRGETPHFDHVCSAAANGINSVSLETGIPVIFGILTTDNIEQALCRSGIKGANKGKEAAEAALELSDLLAQTSKALN